MESALFLDRIGPDLPELGYCLRLIFLGLCTAIGLGLMIPGVVLVYNGLKDARSDTSIPGAIILPVAITCLLCAVYLFVRWTRQQIFYYRRVHQTEPQPQELQP